MYKRQDGGSEVGDIDMGRLDPLFEDAARLVAVSYTPLDVYKRQGRKVWQE